MSRLTQLVGLSGLGVRRVFGRLRGAAPGRMTVCILGVAVAVALLVVVTGVSLGLASSTTVESEDIDYWIVPDDNGAGSVPLESEGARLSQVHEVTAELTRDDRIDYASPVVLQPLQLTNPATGDREYVVAVGVIPTGDQRRVADMDISPLDTEYSHYADDGTYDGQWSGEFVASPAVTERLALTQGDTVDVGNSDRSPHLLISMIVRWLLVSVKSQRLRCRLQSYNLTGLDSADQADQILVSTTDPTVESDLAGVYPQTDVVSRAGIWRRRHTN